MYIPLRRERVQVRGRSGEFLVYWVDYGREVDAVQPVDGAQNAVEEMKFTELFAVWEAVGDAAAQEMPAVRPRRHARRRV